MAYFKKSCGIKVWDDIDDPRDISLVHIDRALDKLSLGELITAQIELVTTMGMVGVLETMAKGVDPEYVNHESQSQTEHAERLRAIICNYINDRLGEE